MISGYTFNHIYDFDTNPPISLHNINYETLYMQILANPSGKAFYVSQRVCDVTIY